MNATATLKFDQSYYELKYDAWLQHRARFRPYATYFSFAMIGIGGFIAAAYPAMRIYGVLFACVGVYELIAALTHKKRWVNKCVNETRANKVVEMQFSETELTTNSSLAHSTIKIAAFSKIIPTPDGVFLIVHEGNSIYIPAKSFQPITSFPQLVDAWTATTSSSQE